MDHDDRHDPRLPVNRFFQAQKLGVGRQLLGDVGLLPLAGRRILEIGCGRGGWLPDLAGWGAAVTDLAGIDLDGERIEAARRGLCGSAGDAADLREGDARALPWPDGAFDLVVQSTVFSSLLEDHDREQVASEMRRVLAPGGAVLWYDFTYDNPSNPSVRKVTRAEVRRLFPGWSIDARRVTLAPPIARRLVPWGRPLATALQAMRLLNTHLLAILRPPDASAG